VGGCLGGAQLFSGLGGLVAGRLCFRRRLADLRATALYPVQRTAAASFRWLRARTEQNTRVGGAKTERDQHNRGNNDSDDPVHSRYAKARGPEEQDILIRHGPPLLRPESVSSGSLVPPFAIAVTYISAFLVPSFPRKRESRLFGPHNGNAGTGCPPARA
jgi:hypothetical protein